MDLNVPQAIRPVIEEAVQRNLIIHAGLMFYRYLDGKITNTQLRGAQLQNIVRKARFTTLSACRSRQESLCRDLRQRGFPIACMEATLMTRMAPGLGITSVFENGIILHHIHGFPYIPGSALKGIAQDYALQVEYRERSNVVLRRQAKKDPCFVAVFGAQTPEKGENISDFQAFRGGAIFFDALPLHDSDLLAVDVMTPHYGDYYSSGGGTAPADYLNPNPIVFLTVREGVRFLFCLAAQEVKDKDGNLSRSAREVLNDAQSWLEGALTILGVGGKTAVGYGYFQDFRDHPLP
ncbi:type III-B CRISPR module RAMP protein Cmr6 [Candidatus Hakubella thermalkaliphila]|uniref:CRISPR-associated protein Cmr6 n=1 Tax=Candidatus Hakubella thermalkaliphila TaxID=2754717 RepID=A0A6V8P961_9ACTN|nr:type III-B CRISPR module RAMP protein Cmr6 [Candidatus Hakubella thermalkaliphila]GFP27356.1 CRISPR-associated protein Cmr6 [Candidatus Hakubella thermalkaliphila]